MTPERSEPPPPTWSEFIGNCYSLAIIIVQCYDSCLLQMDFYFSFLKAYLMLIITFYRYSFAYAASHFHFNSRPPLLLLLLNPAPTRFSLSLIALISVNCSHCGLRHSQFIKIASSVPGNKKRHQCVSSICLLESIFFFHCSCSSLVANRKMWALKSCSHFSRLRISRRAPINFKFLLAFNLLNLFPNTSSFFCGEASLTHVDARSLGRSDRLTRSMARENEAETIRSLKPLWWRCTDEWKAQHETFSLARLMSEELCVGGAAGAWVLSSWASGRKCKWICRYENIFQSRSCCEMYSRKEGIILFAKKLSFHPRGEISIPIKSFSQVSTKSLLCFPFN